MTHTVHSQPTLSSRLSRMDRGQSVPGLRGILRCCTPSSGRPLPAILYPNLPLDLIEALTYGREWQLGYDKLPPLPWWMVEIVYRLIGRDFAYYSLAQVVVVRVFCVCLYGGAADRRRGRRARRGADHRRHALFQFHRGEVQSRRHPAAVLGAGRLCLSARAATRAAALVGAAWASRSAARCGRNISS